MDAAASDSEGEEYRIERLLTCRTFEAGGKAGTCSSNGKRGAMIHARGSARKHMHDEAIADFDRVQKLPFALSELLELPPHAPEALLAREKLLPVADAPPADEDEDEEAEEAAATAEATSAEPAAAEATAAAAPAEDAMKVEDSVAVEAMSDSDDGSPAKEANKAQKVAFDRRRAKTKDIRTIRSRQRRRYPLFPNARRRLTRCSINCSCHPTRRASASTLPHACCVTSSLCLSTRRFRPRSRHRLLSWARTILSAALHAGGRIMARIILPPPPNANAATVVKLQLPRKAGIEYESDDDEEEVKAAKAEEPAKVEETDDAENPAAAGLKSAVLAFDAGLSSRRLRGADIAISAADTESFYSSAEDGLPPPAAIEPILYLLADRNLALDATSELRNKMTAPHPPTARVLWAGRWSKKPATGGKRARTSGSYVEMLEEGEEEDVEASAAAKGESFYPFGSIVAVSGSSVRATVGCSAALAASLPLWGLQLRGDSAWMVRALKPVDAIVLQEGERALIQAQLVDADGKGVPSAERLMRATLLSTPAIPPKMSEAVNLQRDSAVDPLHHGRMPPLTLQKRELNRFMQSLSEHEKEVRMKEIQKQEAREGAEMAAELQAGDKLDPNAVLPEGTRRSAYQAANEEIDDFEEEPLQEWLDGADDDDDDESYIEEGGGEDVGGDDDDDDDDEEDDEDYDAGDDDGGGRKKRRRLSKRAAAKIGNETMKAVIQAAESAAAGSSSGAGASDDKFQREAEVLGYTKTMKKGVDEDEEDEDFVGKGPDEDESESDDEDEEESEEEEGEEDEAAEEEPGVKSETAEAAAAPSEEVAA